MKYEIVLTNKAQNDIVYHKKSGNTSLLKKLSILLKELTHNPFKGKGNPNPKPLKHDLSGKWSRRINLEYRLIYMTDRKKVVILSAKGHY